MNNKSFFFNLILYKKKFFFFKIKDQEKKNRTKTNSGNYVEHTLMQNNNIKGTRQKHFVTSG